MARPKAPIAKVNGKGYILRLPNRRVMVFPCDNGVLIKCKRLGGDGEPRVVTTRLPLSMDAALGMAAMVEQVHEDELARSRVPESVRRKTDGKNSDIVPGE